MEWYFEEIQDYVSRFTAILNLEATALSKNITVNSVRMMLSVSAHLWLSSNNLESGKSLAVMETSGWHGPLNGWR
jgi:hypothetical protein